MSDFPDQATRDLVQNLLDRILAILENNRGDVIEHVITNLVVVTILATTSQPDEMQKHISKNVKRILTEKLAESGIRLRAPKGSRPIN